MGKSSVHVEHELLLRYAMSETPIPGMSAEEGLGLEDRRYIERHLKTCAECRERVERLKVAVEAGDRLLSKAATDHLGEPAPNLLRKFPLQKIRPALLLAAALVLVIAIFSMFIRPWLNPPFASQAAVRDEVNESVVAVVMGMSDMNAGAAHFAKGNYQKAIASFRAATVSEEHASGRGLAHLNLGMTYLKVAEHRKFWLLYKFDRQSADSALVHLTASLQLTGEFPRMRATAFYFSAKAHLMRNDPAAAREALQACTSMKSEKFAAAKQLLEKLSTD